MPLGASRRQNTHTSRDHGDSAAQQQSQLPVCDGLRGSPIDVEAIDDDVVILSSKSVNPQVSNVSRTIHPVTVVLDDGAEDVHLRQSGSTGEEVGTSSIGHHNKRVRISSSTITINYEVHAKFHCSKKAKDKVMNPQPEPAKMPPKEPTFTCPVCLNRLSEPCSTICGHLFCQNCIKASIEAQKKCPTCRRKLNKNSFHRIYLPTAD